jgi:L-ascorbate metabolism protein UlaG (beta-lactamase superfamily)
MNMRRHVPDVDLGPITPAPSRTSGSLTFIGTATVIVEIGGFRFMTDPNFLHQGEHAYLGMGLRSKRLTDPAMELEALPQLDFIVLSHHHGDHFDQHVAERLRRDIPIVTEPGSARKLRQQQFQRVFALETWQTQRMTRGDDTVDITATPAKHAPGPLQSLLPKVMGSILEFGSRGSTSFRLYITGDTLMFDGIARIRERYPQIDLCVIHLGGTRIAGVLLTMDAEQGVSALRVIEPAVAVPIHNDDYTVFKSSLEEFRRAVDAADLTTDVRYLDRGETYTFPLPHPG